MLDTKSHPYFYAVVVALAAVLIYTGDRLEWAPLQALGAALLGLGLLVVGLETLRTRFFDIGINPGRLTSSSRFVFRGPGAVPWGILCTTLGISTVLIAGIVILGMVDEAEQLIARRPGIAIAPLGLIFLGSAAGWLWGEDEMNRSWVVFVATLPQRLGALVTVLFSLALLAVGVFELLAPEAFDRAVDALKPPPAPQVPSRNLTELP